MKSMTGYGESAAQGRTVKVLVQVRTLNHRHLDLQPRIPREYLALEEDIRKRVREKISRGRVELFVTRSQVKGPERKLEINEKLLGQYLQSFRRIKNRYGLKGEIDVSLLTDLPDLFQLTEVERRETEESGLVLKALKAALDNLDRSREREGRQLMLDVAQQARHLGEIAKTLSKEAGKIGVRIKESLVQKEAADPPPVETAASASKGRSMKRRSG
jgi:uncharacterized protein (TIGR00255 family)